MQRIKLARPQATYEAARRIADKAAADRLVADNDTPLSINGQARFGVRRLSSGFVPFERR